MRFDQFFDGSHLVFGQKLGTDLVDADLGCNSARCPLVITGQHDDGLHTLRVKLRHDAFGIRADTVAQFQDAGDTGVVAHGNKGAASPFDAVAQILRNGVAETLLLGKPVRPQPDRPAVCASFKSPARNGSGIFRGGYLDAVGFCPRKNGARQGMRGTCLQPSGEGHQILRRCFAQRMHRRHLGLAHGDRAGLVHGQCSGLARCLNICTALDQHPGPR